MSKRPITYRGQTTVPARARPAHGRRRRRTRAVGVLLALVLTVSIAVVARGIGQDAEPEQRAAVLACHLEECTGDPGVTGADTTRDEVAARARRWLGDTGIRYSMTEGHVGPGGWGWYRRDCSGFVSMALHLPDDDGGATTVGLADVVVAVPVTDLRPYDLIARLGPDSGGEDGHVQLFLGWVDATHTRVRVAEQGGLDVRSPWPHETTYDWPERMNDGTVLRTYRYVRMRD